MAACISALSSSTPVCDADGCVRNGGMLKKQAGREGVEAEGKRGQ